MKLEQLNEQEHVRVRAVIQALLARNFLTREHDAPLYISARRYREEIAEYFQIIGWEFRVDERYEIVWLLSSSAGHRRGLTLEESVWLLVLRLIYEEKRTGLNLSEFPMTTLAEIRAKYLALHLPDLKKTAIQRLTQLSKQYRLADVLDRDLSEEARIRLFHTLTLAVDGEKLSDLHNKLETYRQRKEKDTDEEVAENEGD